MNNSLNKAQKLLRNRKISPMSRDLETSNKKASNFFRYNIEDTSIDFTPNIEFSPTHNDSSLPESLKSIKQSILINKKTPLANNTHIIELTENERKNFEYHLDSNPQYPKTLTIPVFEDKKFHITEQNRRNIKLYQIWPSKNRFLLKGRVIFGPKTDDCHYIFMLLLIFGVTIFFCILVMPYLWTDISPMLPCFIIYLFVSTIVFLFLTTYTDPGIIPKKKVFDLFGGVPSPFAENLDISEETHNNNKKIRDSFGSTKSRKRKKFCSTCEIYRPSRASHCK